MISRAYARTRVSQLMPEPEPATLFSRDLPRVSSTASWGPYSLGRCRFVPPAWAEAESGGITSSTLPTGNWRIPLTTLDAASAPRPKVGDLIGRQDGTRWLVDGVQARIYETWFECSVVQ